MNTFRIATFAALLGTASVFAQSPAEPAEPPQQKTMNLPEFRTLDINGDSQLSKEEARANATVTKLFDELDTDKSGTLSEEEYAKAKSMNKQPPSQPPSQ